MFQPDLFSLSQPGWVALDPTASGELDEILSSLPPAYQVLLVPPERSNALGINSSNFRLSTAEGVFVLKRWSDQFSAQDAHTTLAIMDWLALRQLPVPAPVELQPNCFTLSIGSGTWSLFPFVEGSYFSGAGQELPFSAEASGLLMRALSLLPPACLPAEGPMHLTAADGELLRRVKEASRTWDVLLGNEHAELLASKWSLLMVEWDRLITAPPDGGCTQAAHFDLHPHNLLVSAEGRISAVLDFESCRMMPVGFAVGFASLKQCRQAMVLHGSAGDPHRVGLSYADHLQRANPAARGLVAQLGDLAVAETLRRICAILRLNLESGEKKWNKLLKVQLGHLSEARALFG